MSDYVTAHCRLAEQIPEYADEHQRCQGAEDVRLPDGTLVISGNCACHCHTDGGTA